MTKYCINLNLTDAMMVSFDQAAGHPVSLSRVELIATMIIIFNTKKSELLHQTYEFC